jgi:hypothetical protein
MDTTGYPSTHKILGLIIASIFLVTASASATHTYTNNLPISDNITLITELKAILGEYHFTTPYAIGVFDCVESSYVVQTLLRARGYDAYVMYRIVPTYSDDDSHAWCVVQDHDDTYAVIETTLWANGYNAVGGVVIPEDVVIYKMDAGYLTKEPKKFLSGMMNSIAHRLDENITALVVPNQVSPRS